MDITFKKQVVGEVLFYSYSIFLKYFFPEETLKSPPVVLFNNSSKFLETSPRPVLVNQSFWQSSIINGCYSVRIPKHWRKMLNYSKIFIVDYKWQPHFHFYYFHKIKHYCKFFNRDKNSEKLNPFPQYSVLIGKDELKDPYQIKDKIQYAVWW